MSQTVSFFQKFQSWLFKGHLGLIDFKTQYDDQFTRVIAMSPMVSFFEQFKDLL